MTKAIFLRLSILLLFYDGIEGFIIPEEVPTILSLIWSNIPPIKKGTDSRVGVGFRLGEHADFQIVMELGPQKETEPIGPSADQKIRRMATFGAAMRGEMGPWAQSVAQYQMQLKMQKELERIKLLKDKMAKTGLNKGEKSNQKKTASDDWLTKWSKGEDLTDQKITSTKVLPGEKLTINVKNDRRAVQNGETLDDKKYDLQKLLKPQPTS